MHHINAIIEKTGYTTQLLSDSGLTSVADEPVTNGGNNAGFSPHELLAAALASCTSITLRMYANHKQWNLENLKVDVFIDKDVKQNSTFIECNIVLPAALSVEQKERLLHIAKQCPIHKLLANSIVINTTIQ